VAASVNRRKRFWRILRLFFRLLLSFLTAYLGARLVGHSYDFFEDHERNRVRARLIRDAALEMGGVIIKVGQFLSTRVDVLPEEYIEELALLQDEVPAVPFDEVRQVVEKSFEQPLHEVYACFDPTPLAAASLGQVHRAMVWSGQQVVVKVKRPSIDAIVEADLAGLEFVVSWLDRWSVVRRRIDLPGILREFRETLSKELDYLAEAHHAERFAIAFHNDPHVAIPRVYWSHVRPQVLTLEYMWGIKISDYERIDQAGISRSQLAEILLQAYLKQILIDGFFHADPHPGNLFVRPGPIVAFVDFGMVGRLTPQMRENIRRVFLGIVHRDFDGVIHALVRLGFLRPTADLALVKEALIWAVDTFYELSFAELRSLDPREVLRHFQDVLRIGAFQIPTNFAFLSRALGTLVGLCTGLDPSFQFVTVAEPFARQLMAEGSAFGMLGRIGEEARSLAETAIVLPHLARNVLERLDQGGLNLRRDIADVRYAVDRLERAIRRLFYGLLVAALLLTTALLLPSHVHVLAYVSLGVAGLLVLRVLFFGRR
jgi:predicted unusual protein kinase regulating ubiquinone biosynthesis (AarF/ABC1/UbiB family)